jgi:hypothetical protein
MSIFFGGLLKFVRTRKFHFRVWKKDSVFKNEKNVIKSGSTKNNTKIFPAANEII